MRDGKLARTHDRARSVPEQAIVDLIYRYCRPVDRLDLALGQALAAIHAATTC